ncbi:MAG TPA: 30S ribosome-binding factor RbfA [candidate division WOR-3 bacterium]|uniref:Ribosome-binding factor A n=1 Tax=candidate division WOR-3 bacterium TaxID=2052148 RepID=A0A9C9EMK6_UNCW3|nr:30S ribosome-binding factor RbfA [candidate division WOR-3 bacterium]
MRKDRVASVLEREISNIVTQEIRDPRLGFITITSVEVTADLKTAVIYFSSLGDKVESFQTLKRAKGYIRSVLAHRIRLRSVPELEFKIDNSYEYRQRIDELFKKISTDDKEE